MTMSRPIHAGSFAFLLLAALAPSARADVIDGDWCYSDGRHLTIKGPEILTPSGNKTAGNYSRHSFTYVAPAGEPAAGETIAMTLINENVMHLRRGETAASGSASPPPTEIWRRCSATVSALPQPPTEAARLY